MASGVREGNELYAHPLLALHGFYSSCYYSYDGCHVPSTKGKLVSNEDILGKANETPECEVMH